MADISWAEAQNDYAEWSADHDGWLKEISRWQADHQVGIIDLERLEAFIMKTGTALREHADIAEVHARICGRHAQEILGSTGMGALSNALATAHRDMAAVHARTSDAHARIKRDHEHVMARLHALVETIRRTERQATGAESEAASPWRRSASEKGESL